ncbi:MAG: tRNA 2-thiouridine(34) synthase MnmA [Elusimicrobiota bacterium]|jgi:tRNA-specific 2-thiouridylase
MSRVVVAMSGGVDSCTAAALCVEAGHETIGVTLKLSGALSAGSGCCGTSDLADARKAAEKLGIPHYAMDFSEIFEKTVVEPFIADYLRQRTPNPCVECNRRVKFGALLKLVEAWKADLLATGHYARIVPEETPQGTEYRLLRAEDAGKDQSYFLYRLTQQELVRVLFPIGGMKKEEVRQKARSLDLPAAEKAESMEVCFVPGDDYRVFLRARAGEKAFEPGDIRDMSGRKLGRHKGLASYTVGQRKGLGLGGPKPLYVARLDAGSNTLVVGTEQEVARRSFTVSAVSWTRGPRSGGQAGLKVRVRHRGRLLEASWSRTGEEGLRVDLRDPERAIAPGQSAVFYEGQEVLGGGIIEEAQ